MTKSEFFKLKAKKDQRIHDIEELNRTIQDKRLHIQQLNDKRLSDLRARDLAGASSAQLNIDALNLDCTDLQAKIDDLKNGCLDQTSVECAWKSDLVESPEYKAELSAYEAVAAFYDVMCVRAKHRYQEWISLADDLTVLQQGNAFPPQYVAPDPSGRLNIHGWKYASRGGCLSSTDVLSPESIDRLIAMLQQIKANGVASIL